MAQHNLRSAISVAKWQFTCGAVATLQSLLKSLSADMRCVMLSVLRSYFHALRLYRLRFAMMLHAAPIVVVCACFDVRRLVRACICVCMCAC